MISQDVHARDVQHALRHLYDPDLLRQSPLTAIVDLDAEVDAAPALRRLLCDAIRAMRPDDSIPPDTRPWRDYQVLLLRYVRGCSQLEVAHQLGLSVRHLRREEQRAIESLARCLTKRRADEGPARGAGAAPTRVTTDGPTVEAELAWLADAGVPCDVGPVLTTALQLIAPMAAQHGVQVARSGPESGCLAAVNAVAARQALLVLLSVALRHAQAGLMKVDMRDCGWLVKVAVVVTAQVPVLPALTPEDQESLNVVRRLLAACGGQVRVQHEPGVLDLVAEFPAVEQIPVLAIEDNVDTVRLLERYLAGTRYRLQSASRVDQALSLAARAAPRAIILDVVMPDIDGWESLQRLRQHPVTQDVPVLVCTILPEQELALSLGAAAFVHKPFRRDELCRALDRLIDREAKALPSPHGSR